MSRHSMTIRNDTKLNMWAECPCGWKSKVYKYNFRYPGNAARFAMEAATKHYNEGKESRANQEG